MGITDTDMAHCRPNNQSHEYLIIGHTMAVYGLKGWLKVKPFTQSDIDLLSYKRCFIRHSNTNKQKDSQCWQKVSLEQGKPHSKGLLVKFDGVDNRTEAEAWLKCDIAIKHDDLPDLDKNEYYWYQLEGLNVLAGDQLLGTISHLLETGSNDVLVVKPCAGSLDKKERLIPYRPEVILNIDLDANNLCVDWELDF